ncbi:MAG: hypothetical protein JNK32_03055 [Anaerolineales bacterium]|nr:hypothetical protein [Anaerolineales bacterium]
MDRATEKRLARAPYNWLRISPLVTISTLFYIIAMDIGRSVCSDCNTNIIDLLNSSLGVLVSALWHLILLQYVNNKESELVRKHGRQALTYAGIRTGIAFVTALLETFTGAGGAIACWIVPVLLILWFFNSSAGYKQVERDLPEPEEANIEPRPLTKNREETFENILAGLQSPDDVAVFMAFDKLKGVSNPSEEILKELELLARKDDNQHIQKQARAILDQGKEPVPSEQAVNTEEEIVTVSQGQSPQEVLNHIRNLLASNEDADRLAAMEKLKNLKYSSSAIRLAIEQIALHDPNEDLRKEALSLLNHPTHRYIIAQANIIPITERRLLLSEIDKLVRENLLSADIANVIRKRYDFDIAPQPKPEPAPAQMAVTQPPAESEAKQEARPVPAPVAAPPSQPREPVAPRATLLQTLLSETSIKIALYLGAFFVIASAIILAAAVPETRLPILIIGTLIFGSVAVAIRKRLPQPSFALFIVFSFLLPITANVVEDLFKFGPEARAGYWVVICLFMALIWSGGTWLYSSRLFSITAFISLTIATLRIGDALNAEFEVYTIMIGLTALVGLGGTAILKKWKDSKFALPLFLAAQLLQVGVLAGSFAIFIYRFFPPVDAPLWNLASIPVWGFAFAFYVLSNRIYPFVAFPWLTAATLLSVPWFLFAAFEMESLAACLTFLAWGTLLAAVSEGIFRIERPREYSLPILLTSVPTLIFAIGFGFTKDVVTGMVSALAVMVIHGILHGLRARGGLWALALLSFITAYFSFFALPFMENVEIFFGYKLLGLSLIFLLPDLLLKNDLRHNLHWRLPPRLYGILFTLWNFIAFAPAEEKPYIHTAVIFAVYTILAVLYALRYNLPWVGYIGTLALTISTIYTVNHFHLDLWFEALSVLAILYFSSGYLLKENESRAAWRTMLEASGLVLGSIVSIVALLAVREYSGWFIAAIGSLFIVEMYTRKQSLFEVGAHILLSMGSLLILHDFNIREVSYNPLVVSLIVLTLDLVFSRSYQAARNLEWIVKGLGAILALTASFFFTQAATQDAVIGFSILTIFFAVYALVQKQAAYAYIPATYLPITLVYILHLFKLDAWLPALTALAVLYFVVGLALRAKPKWSFMFRNSALALGTILSFTALFTLKETSGWYALVIGLLFAAEMYLRRDGRFEFGLPIMFNIGAFLILRDLHIEEVAYHLLTFSLVWLLADLLAHLTFTHPRILKLPVRGIGALLCTINFPILFFTGWTNDATVSAVGFGVYALLFLTVSLVYKNPNLFYAFTVTLPLFVIFLCRDLNIEKWIHPLIVIAVIYYAAGYILRRSEHFKGWDSALLFSGLGLGVIVSLAAPAFGGLDAALPVAVAATLWAVEAFAKKNAWLAFPANILYLLAYFIILIELNQDEPQFYSMGAALLGLIQHYLLVRAGSKTGAFLTGMVSQLILLGTTYIQMVTSGSGGLIYFVVLFLQSLAVLVYGIVIRSRSLTFTPIILVVLGVVTVLYSAFQGMNTVVLIGCTGILMLIFGIIAVLMRERITKLGERLSDWRA